MSDITTGTNSYYIVQVIRHRQSANQVDDGDASKASKRSNKPATVKHTTDNNVAFTLFCKWGRTGTAIGSSKVAKLRSEAEAVAEFAYVPLYYLSSPIPPSMCIAYEKLVCDAFIDGTHT